MPLALGESRAHAPISRVSPENLAHRRLLGGCRSPPRTNLLARFPWSAESSQGFFHFGAIGGPSEPEKCSEKLFIVHNSLLIGARNFYCGSGKQIAWSASKQRLGSRRLQKLVRDSAGSAGSMVICRNSVKIGSPTASPLAKRAGPVPSGR